MCSSLWGEDLGLEVIPLDCHPLRERLCSESQGPSPTVFTLSELAASHRTPKPPARLALSWLERRHRQLVLLVVSHSLLAVQPLCLATGAQLKPEPMEHMIPSYLQHEMVCQLFKDSLEPCGCPLKQLLHSAEHKKMLCKQLTLHQSQFTSCGSGSTRLVCSLPAEIMAFQVTSTKGFDSWVVSHCIWLSYCLSYHFCDSLFLGGAVFNAHPCRSEGIKAKWLMHSEQNKPFLTLVACSWILKKLKYQSLWFWLLFLSYNTHYLSV